MNAISLLRSDHRKVQKLFRAFECAGARAFRQRQRIARKACMELEIHSQLEEQLFYPAVQTATDAKGQDLVHVAIKEHHIVQTIIDELTVMSSEAENYGPTFNRLVEHVEHHIREEERELLPGARDQLGQERLEYLGDQMVKRKRELTPAHPSRLRDTLRQAKRFATVAYDALTGAESEKPHARRRGKSAPERHMPNPKQVVHAKAKGRAQSGQTPHATQPARVKSGPTTGRSAQSVHRAVAKAKVVVKKGAAKASYPRGANVRAIGADRRLPRLRGNGSRSDIIPPREDEMARSRR